MPQRTGREKRQASQRFAHLVGALGKGPDGDRRCYDTSEFAGEGRFADEDPAPIFASRLEGLSRSLRAEQTRIHGLAAQYARAMQESFAPENRGRGECRVPNAPAASCALCSFSMHTSIHSGGTGYIRHSPRNGFNSLFRALPGDRALLPPSPAMMPSIIADLAPASGRQDHTISPSASSAARLASPNRPPHPAPRS